MSKILATIAETGQREVYLISWLSPIRKEQEGIGVPNGKGSYRVTTGYGSESWNYYHAVSLSMAIEYCQTGGHAYEIEDGTPSGVIYVAGGAK